MTSRPTVCGAAKNLACALLVTFAALALAGCLAASGPLKQRTLSVRVLHNALQCGNQFRVAAALWIDDDAMLASHFAATVATADSAAPAKIRPPEVDFQRYDVLLIAMGRKPTSGYRLNYLDQRPVTLTGPVLQVPVAWLEPDPDARVAQVMTSPCLILRLPKAIFSQLQVVDQRDLVKLELKRPAGS